MRMSTWWHNFSFWGKLKTVFQNCLFDCVRGRSGLTYCCFSQKPSQIDMEGRAGPLHSRQPPPDTGELPTRTQTQWVRSLNRTKQETKAHKEGKTRGVKKVLLSYSRQSYLQSLVWCSYVRKCVCACVCESDSEGCWDTLGAAQPLVIQNLHQSIAYRSCKEGNGRQIWVIMFLTPDHWCKPVRDCLPQRTWGIIHI